VGRAASRKKRDWQAAETPLRRISSDGFRAHNNPHNGDPRSSASRSARIEPTCDAFALIAEAVRLLRRCWKPGCRYANA